MGLEAESTGSRAGLTGGRRPAPGRPAGFDTIATVKSSQPAAFEVYCDRCRVTFPVGTRRCMHCGGPTTGSRARRPPGREPEPEPLEAEPEAEIGPRRLVSPLTLVWIVLIAVGYLVRACSGQAP